MSALPDLFPGFAERRIKTDAGVEIYLRTGGSGPPLLLLHGYPQTHVAWHKIAPELARHCTLVVADLRGYGASSAPPGDAEHHTYSKRAMAEDCLAVMRALGHERFMVAGHDRGGRVAYRLALDHPDAVSALIPIDILPTAEVWRAHDRGKHAQVLSLGVPGAAEPHARDADRQGPGLLSRAHAEELGQVARSVAVLAGSAGTLSRAADTTLRAFTPSARTIAPAPPSIAQLDEADLAAGRKIECPTFVLWARSYLPGDPLEVWRAWCTNVTGASIDSGHFLAEENPQDTLAALVPFLTQ